MQSATTHGLRQPRQRHSSPLRWFAVLSLLLHAALFAWWQSKSVTISAPPSAGMSVHLIERQQAEPAAKPAPAVQAAARPKPAPRRQAASKTESRQVTATASEQHTQAATEEAAAFDEAALQSTLQVTLQQAIARHFTYPLIARKRGWQGEVLLAFRLAADGRIIDARVARSSGHRLLDHAALTALGKIGRIETGATNGFAMELPVIYRLEG